MATIPHNMEFGFSLASNLSGPLKGHHLLGPEVLRPHGVLPPDSKSICFGVRLLPRLDRSGWGGLSSLGDGFELRKVFAGPLLDSNHFLACNLRGEEPVWLLVLAQEVKKKTHGKPIRGMRPHQSPPTGDQKLSRTCCKTLQGLTSRVDGPKKGPGTFKRVHWQVDVFHFVTGCSLRKP